MPQSKLKSLGFAQMRSSLRAVKEFLSENSAIVVAATSLGVAALSLFYTVQTQQSDILYKELSIKPLLVLRYDTVDFSLKIANVGIGPAVIKSVSISGLNRCIDSKVVERETWTSNARVILPEIFNHIFGEFWSVLSAARPQGFKPFLSAKTLSPGQYIQNGTEYVIAKAGESDTKSFYEHPEIRPEARQAAIQSFAERSERVPLKIDYCSVSEKFCNTLGTLSCQRP